MNIELHRTRRFLERPRSRALDEAVRHQRIITTRASEAFEALGRGKRDPGRRYA
jgi:hypothetical protein